MSKGRPSQVLHVHLLPVTPVLEPALHVLIVQDLGKFLIANYKEAQRPNLPQISPRVQLHDPTETAAVRPGQYSIVL